MEAKYDTQNKKNRGNCNKKRKFRKAKERQKEGDNDTNKRVGTKRERKTR